MVRLILLILLIPLVFGAMKPIAGISEVPGDAVVYVETFLGSCQTVPVPVNGETYATNLQNLRFASGSDCSSNWNIGDVIYVEINGLRSNMSVINPGSNVQFLPEIIYSERTPTEIIERNRPEKEVIFVPIELIEDDVGGALEEGNITIPSRSIDNLTQTIKYSVSDLYYRSIEPTSESESVWRYLVLIIFVLLVFIGWGVRS